VPPGAESEVIPTQILATLRIPLPDENTPLLKAALAYAWRGWRVVPLHHLLDGACSCGHVSCRPGGKEEKSIAKHPRPHQWQIEASTNEERIYTWWQEWPNANVGIATGAESGLVVLDVDVHEGKTGPTSLAALEEELGALPPTLTARTGSGGEHRLFRAPDFIVRDSTHWRGATGVDWRADGGQIVAVPSVALAGRYAWLNDLKVAALPPAWVEAHRKHEAERGTKATVVLESAPPTAEELAEDKRIVEKASTAANAKKFRALWTGRWKDLGYPSQSEADAALVQILEFWCEGDAARIDRLFRQSGLNRDKWQSRPDYREKTISRAMAFGVERRQSATRWRETIEQIIARAKKRKCSHG
jgi:hypothetical protein